MDESRTYEAEFSKKVASGRRVAGALRSLVNARSLQLECSRVLHQSLLVLVFTYDSETMILRENERSRIRAVQIDNLRGLLDVRIMDKVPNARIMQLCGVTKGMDERLMKVFSDGAAMWKEWRTTELLRGSMWESVLVH